jgi:hypothetical protein
VKEIRRSPGIHARHLGWHSKARVGSNPTSIGVDSSSGGVGSVGISNHPPLLRLMGSVGAVPAVLTLNVAVLGAAGAKQALQAADLER